jgi:hypothetical protein
MDKWRSPPDLATITPCTIFISLENASLTADTNGARFLGATESVKFIRDKSIYSHRGPSLQAGRAVLSSGRFSFRFVWSRSKGSPSLSAAGNYSPSASVTNVKAYFEHKNNGMLAVANSTWFVNLLLVENVSSSNFLLEVKLWIIATAVGADVARIALWQDFTVI